MVWQKEIEIQGQLLTLFIVSLAITAYSFPQVSRFRYFWFVCSFADIIPDIIFLLAYPNLEYYGGLSGLAVGAVAYFCLCSIFKTKRKKLIWLLILIVMGAKIVIEAVMNEPVFVQVEYTPFRVLPSAHIVGFLGALISIIWSRINIPLHRYLTLKKQKIEKMKQPIQM